MLGCTQRYAHRYCTIVQQHCGSWWTAVCVLTEISLGKTNTVEVTNWIELSSVRYSLIALTVTAKGFDEEKLLAGGLLGSPTITEESWQSHLRRPEEWAVWRIPKMLKEDLSVILT